MFSVQKKLIYDRLIFAYFVYLNVTACKYSTLIPFLERAYCILNTCDCVANIEWIPMAENRPNSTNWRFLIHRVISVYPLSLEFCNDLLSHEVQHLQGETGRESHKSIPLHYRIAGESLWCPLTVDMSFAALWHRSQLDEPHDDPCCLRAVRGRRPDCRKQVRHRHFLGGVTDM